MRVETLARDHGTDQRGARTGWEPVDAEPPSQELHDHDGGFATGAPTRSVRRATARRASNRRATARNRQSDTEARIIDFLARHPESTVGALAKGLNLKPEYISTRLTQLSGEIKRDCTATDSTQRAVRLASSAHSIAHVEPGFPPPRPPATTCRSPVPWQQHSLEAPDAPQSPRWRPSVDDVPDAQQQRLLERLRQAGDKPLALVSCAPAGLPSPPPSSPSSSSTATSSSASMTTAG